MDEAASTGLVAIVASAGGIAALRRILAGLEPTFAAPILCCQHLPPFPSSLREVLARATRLEVRWAKSGDRVEPGVAFLAPPFTTLQVLPDGTLRVHDSAHGRWFREIDAFYESVAECFGPRAVGVVLTGMALPSLSMRGVESIHARGGSVIVQDEASSEYWGMPNGALVTGCVERVMPIDGIARELERLAVRPAEPPVPDTERDLVRELQTMLDTSIALDRAQLGNVQLYDRDAGTLRIVAQRGFQRPFLDHFRVVRAQEGSVCSRALRGDAVVVEDITSDRLFVPHREIARDAGFSSVRSTPLFEDGRNLVGMLSTHRRAVGAFPQWERREIVRRAGQVLARL